MCSMDNISESGWTMYFDPSSYTHKSTTQTCKKASGVTGNENDESSMLSDASSGPQLLKYDEKDQPPSASYTTRIKPLHGRRKDLECVSSFSFGNGNPRTCKLRRDEADRSSLLQDTASSSFVRSSESGLVEGEVNSGAELSDESLVHIQGEEKNLRLQAMQSLVLPNGEKPHFDGVCDWSDAEEEEEDGMEYIVKFEAEDGNNCQQHMGLGRRCP